MKSNQNFQFLRGKITARKARFVWFHRALAFSFPGAPIVILARPISPLPFEWRILLVPTARSNLFPYLIPFVLSSFVVNVCKSSIKHPRGLIYLKPVWGGLFERGGGNKPSRISPHEVLPSWLINRVSYLLTRVQPSPLPHLGGIWFGLRTLSSLF